MKLALYHPWIYLRGGIERTILEYINHSRHDWTIFTSRYEPENTFEDLKNKKIIELNKVSVKRSYSQVNNAALKILTSKIDLSDFDALMVCCEGLGDLVTFRNHSKPIVCLCCTPLKVWHDPVTKNRYLKNNKNKALLFYIFGKLFEVIDKRAWKHYKHVFCISQETRDRVLKAGLTTKKKIDITYPGVTPPVTKKLQYKPFFLVFGRIMWQKNIELAIEAFKIFSSDKANNNFKLIIAGTVDKKSISYFAELKNKAKDFNVEFIESPNDKELSGLYSTCYANIFTAPNEDWGIVPLEAMAYSKPVLSVNQGGPAESIIDGKTGFLLEPNAAVFAKKMDALAKNIELTKLLGQEGKKHVSKFSWPNFAKTIDDYFNIIKHN